MSDLLGVGGAAQAAASAYGSTLNALTGIANASNSDSQSTTSGQSTSVQDSSSFSEGASSSWSQQDAENWANSFSEAISQVLGSEASAADIQRAYEANMLQRDLWLQQANYNAQEAAKDREYQERLSNTAYQRAVLDLQKAGLNPILAAGNMGASTPSGALASSGLATAQKANTYADSYSYSTGGSNSYGYSRGRGGSSSYSRGGSTSHGESQSTSSGQSTSQTRTQLASVLEGLAGLIGNANSGSTEANQYDGGGGGHSF